MYFFLYEKRAKLNIFSHLRFAALQIAFESQVFYMMFVANLLLSGHICTLIIYIE